MAVTIKEMTTGYSSEGLNQYYKDLQTKMILETENKLDDVLRTTYRALDTFWADGVAKGQFKFSLAENVVQAKKSLEDIRTKIQSQMVKVAASNILTDAALGVSYDVYNK